MKRGILIFGAVALFGYGIYTYLKKQADLLKDFTWKISAIKFKTISLNEVTLDVTFLFSSKADLEATINKLYLDVFIEETNVGFIKQDESFIIPAKGSTNIPLRLSINPQYVLKNIINVSLGAAKKKDIKLKIKGFANVKSGFVSTTLPIEYETTIKEYLGIIPSK